MSNESIKKRLVDLLNEGTIEVVYSEEYRGNNVSVYRIKTDNEIDSISKITFKKWVKGKYPEIVKEYDLLFS